jgi:uncharacterized membrane protein YgaE (UPF0421/DUF939 family)
MPVQIPLTVSWRHPHPVLAAKTAIAAGAAWLLVQPLGGFVHDYPYYAPLGAVVAMSTSVVESIRSAAQAVAAILAGAGLAFAVDTLPLAQPAAVALGIGLGVLVSAAPTFGSMGSWVPFATLFVLIIGGDDPWQYAAAYGGLTAFGAIIGLLINAALPQLPLTPAVQAQDRLREQLAEQLDLLADGLAYEQPLSREEWTDLELALVPHARRADELVHVAAESRRGNWRAARWATAADRREAQARALRRLTGCVREVSALVTDVRTSVHADSDVAARLRRRTTDALRAVAAMLWAVHPNADQPDATEATQAASSQAARAVSRLAREAAGAGAAAGHRYLSAAAIAVTLDQAIDAWA